MNDPVRIFGSADHSSMEEPLLTYEEIRMLDKQRFQHRLQAGFFIFVGVVILAVLSPLVIWLARIAGGW